MKTNVRSRLNRMAEVIRERRAVPIGELCLIMNLAPSTVYQYARLMRNVYLDIQFENGIFQVTYQPIEKITGQRELPL